MTQELAGMRVDYAGEALDVDGLAGTWHEQLAKWFAEAAEAGVPEVNAMVLDRGHRRAAVLAHGALQGD